MRWDRVGVGCLALAMAAASSYWLLSWWLSATYVPSAGQAWDSAGDSGSTQSSGWRTAQMLLVAPWFLLTLAGLVISVVVVVQRRRLPSTVAVGVGAVAALGGLLASSGTAGLLEWDQIGLWAVTVGTNLDGYWAAGFSDGVRFVLVGGNEVGQQTYRTVLVIHLVSPLFAVGGLLTLFVALRRPHAGDEVPPPVTTASWGPVAPERRERSEPELLRQPAAASPTITPAQTT